VSTVPVIQYEDPTYLEAVYAALFEKLKTAVFPGGIALKITERRVEPPADMAEQPAMVLVPGPFEVKQEHFGLSKWTLTAHAVVYVRVNNLEGDSELAARTCNYIFWGLYQSLLPARDGEKQTLGGLVYHCWAEGTGGIEVINEQAIVALPIYISAGPYG
jgi:hypothetical protein